MLKRPFLGLLLLAAATFACDRAFGADHREACPTTRPPDPPFVPPPPYPTDMGSTVCNVTDESTGAMPMPSAWSLLNLAATGSVGFSGTVVVTMFLNGSAAALTCTISTAVNPNNQCTDTIHRVAVHRGDLVGVQLTGPNIDIPNLRVTAEKR